MPHHHCCILGCRSDSRYSKRDDVPSTSTDALRFFCIPSLTSKTALHYEWLRMIGRPDLNVSKNTRVCSLHFINGKPTKENPIPTLNLQFINMPTRRRIRSPKAIQTPRKKTNGKIAFYKNINLKNWAMDVFNSKISEDDKTMWKGKTYKDLYEQQVLNCLMDEKSKQTGALQLKITTSPKPTSLQQSLLSPKMETSTSLHTPINKSLTITPTMEAPRHSKPNKNLNYTTPKEINASPLRSSLNPSFALISKMEEPESMPNHCFPHFIAEAPYDGKLRCNYEMTSDENSCSNSLMVVPETIIHEYKQTQTENSFEEKVSTETQTELLTPLTRVPLILWEGANEKNYQFQCQQLRARVSYLKQQIRKRTNNVFVNFGIDVVKKDTNMMRYYTGFSSHADFRIFLEKLEPKFFPENFSLDCLYTLENELLLVLAFKRLSLNIQDLSYRSGVNVYRIEQIINDWSSILDQHSSKPWLTN